jgi:uncharacterized membrane protein
VSAADDGPSRPVSWTSSGEIQPLRTPIPRAEAIDVNDAGEVIGYGLIPADDASETEQEHVLFWTARHEVRNLGVLPGTDHAEPRALSTDGWAVGEAWSGDPNADAEGLIRAWVWPHTGLLVALPTPTGEQSRASGIVDESIAGAVGGDFNQGCRAVVWRCRSD